MEAGLLWGFVEVVTTVGVAAIALTIAPFVSPEQGFKARDYASLVAEWLVLSLSTGAVAAWARQLRPITTSSSRARVAATYLNDRVRRSASARSGWR